MKSSFSIFKNTARVAMLLTAVTLAAACTKDKTKPDAAILAIDKKADPIEFSAAATESHTYKVTTNQSTWDAQSDQTWCKITKTADTFTLTADENKTITAPPEATITVTAGDATPITIKVTQKGADATLSIDPAPEGGKIEFPTAGETKSYTVTTNHSSWDVVSDQKWCEVTKSADGFTLTADAATTTVAPEEATITVTAGDAMPVIIKATQKAADATLSITPVPEGGVVEFPVRGETKVFIVTTTVPSWSVESDKDWCKAEKTADGKGFTLKAEEAALDPTEDATVTISAGDAEEIVLVAKQKGRTLSEFSDNTVAAPNFSSGNGTEESPYLINSAAELKLLVDIDRNQVRGVHYRLETDIIVTAASWKPIGISLGPNSFEGTFDGNGHTIFGKLIIDNMYGGFFGYLGFTQGGIVKNLTVDAEISNNSSSYSTSTGAIAGYVYKNSRITGCRVRGSVSGPQGRDYGKEMTYIRTGGIAGSCSGVIENCTNYASVNGGNCITTSSYSIDTGGIVGAADGSITGCINYGTVTGGWFINDDVGVGTVTTGGIGGYTGSGHQNSNNGAVIGGKGQIVYTGGISGEGSTFSCSSNTGTVDGAPASNDNRVGNGSVNDCTDGH